MPPKALAPGPNLRPNTPLIKFLAKNFLLSAGFKSFIPSYIRYPIIGIRNAGFIIPAIFIAAFFKKPRRSALLRQSPPINQSIKGRPLCAPRRKALRCSRLSRKEGLSAAGCGKRNSPKLSPLTPAVTGASVIEPVALARNCLLL